MSNLQININQRKSEDVNQPQLICFDSYISVYYLGKVGIDDVRCS